MKKLSLIILSLALIGNAIAECVCTFDGTDYEIKKGMFGLVYGTPVKKVPPNPTPTPTATPKPTATPAPTPTGTPRRTPTATPAPIGKAPRGIMYLLRQHPDDIKGFTNREMDGVRLRQGWKDVQAKIDGLCNWSEVDQVLANAQKNHKQIGISFVALAEEANPTGLEAAGCKMVQLSSGKVPWINDPVYLEKLCKFIAQLGARYDGKINYVAMGGMGAQDIESGMGKTPEDIAALDALGGLEGWKSAAKVITQQYSDSFPHTSFIFCAAAPYANEVGKTALKEILDFVAPKYGERFGIMNASLAAHSDTGYIPHSYVKKYSLTHSCGLQFLTNCVEGFTGHTCGGTVKEVLDAGIAILNGKGFIETYPADADLASNAQAFKDASARLK